MSSSLCSDFLRMSCSVTAGNRISLRKLWIIKFCAIYFSPSFGLKRKTREQSEVKYNKQTRLLWLRLKAIMVENFCVTIVRRYVSEALVSINPANE